MDKSELGTGRPGRFCQAQTPKLPEVRHFLFQDHGSGARRPGKLRGWQTPKLPEVRHFLLAGITAVVPQGAPGVEDDQDPWFSAKNFC